MLTFPTLGRIDERVKPNKNELALSSLLLFYKQNPTRTVVTLGLMAFSYKARFHNKMMVMANVMTT